MNNRFMKDKGATVLLFIFLWGSVLTSCVSNSNKEDVKLNENLDKIISSNTEPIQDQPLPTDIAISPTFIPSPITPAIGNIKTDLPVDTSSLFQTELFSPLEGFDLDELTEIVSNPFNYAGNGKDEGHHGTDFSFYQYESFDKIENLTVHSMTSGRVSSIINNRPPYGNMVMVETPFSSLPVFLRNHLLFLQPESELPFHSNLSCPDFQFEENSQISEFLSLYILYAHLYSPPEVQIESFVLSREEIGKVGNTGSSGNPHLHLEFRIGPSGYSFEEMSHYDNTASPNEIYNYCLWRVSGLFYQVNPMKIIEYYLQNR